MTTPIQNPAAFNAILLDTVRSPGLCVRVGGGERKQQVQNQQGPGFSGAFTVFRFEEIATIEYRFELWTPSHFDAWRTFSAMLRAGSKKRPPRVYTLTDYAVAHNEIKAVACVSVGRLETLSPTKWGVQVGFTEYRKRQPIGGPVAPSKTGNEAKIAAELDAVAALRTQLAAMNAAKGKP